MTAAHVDTGVRDSVMTSELGYPRYPTIIHALAQAAELNPAAPGLMCQERLLSYREYAHGRGATPRCSPISASRANASLVMMPNSMEAAVALLAGMAARAQVSPLNPAYTEREARTAIARCRAARAGLRCRVGAARA